MNIQVGVAGSQPQTYWEPVTPKATNVDAKWTQRGSSTSSYKNDKSNKVSIGEGCL